MADQFPSDAGWWTVAAVSACGGFRWLMTWRARRADICHGKLRVWDTDLQAREAAIDAKVTEHMAQCEDELRALRGEMRDVARRCERAEIAMILLAHETHDRNPQSIALQQVKALLGRDFPLDFNTPAEMAALLARIGGKTGG